MAKDKVQMKSSFIWSCFLFTQFEEICI